MDSMEQHPVVGAIAASDPEIAERLVTRRSAILRGAAVSSAVATGLRAASVPVALAALARDSFGQARLPAPVVNVLNFALVLEELESRFYIRAVDSGIIPSRDLAIFTTIRDHEVAHVKYLRDALGPSARPAPTFDFTAGNGSGTGPYRDVFTNYATLQAVAQAFEDTGVRAYKGQAPALIPYKDVLTAALTIHSVEARHASEIRRLRGGFTEEGPFGQGWINDARTDVPGAAATYAGEDNVTQGGVDLVALVPSVARTEITESFDEPLTQAQVLAIVDPFIV